MSPIATHADFPVPISRAGCMSYLVHLMADGYSYWHSGSVHFEKAEGFVQKMRMLYPIEATPGQRAVAKSKGRANVQLVIFPDQARPGFLVWYLLATRGKPFVDPLTGEVQEEKGFSDLIFQREKMKDGRKIALTWCSHYRLLQHQPARDPNKRKSQKRVWTWRLTDETYRQWALRLADVAKAGLGPLRREIKPLLISPMFSGVREDIARLGDLAEAAYRKQHKNSTYISPLPVVLPYLAKVPVFRDATLLSLVALLRQQEADAKVQAMAAVKSLQSGETEPPNRFSQSLFLDREKVDGVDQEEGGVGPSQAHPGD